MLEPTLLHVLGMLFLGICIARWALTGVHRSTATAQGDARGWSRPHVSVRSNGEAVLNDEALRLLGAEARQAASVDDIVRFFGDEADSLRGSICNLVERGRGFERILVDRRGRVIEAVGHTIGGRAGLTLRDRSEDVLALRESEGALEAAKDRIEALEAAAAKAGLYILEGSEPDLASDQASSRYHAEAEDDDYARIRRAAKAVPQDLFDGARVELSEEADHVRKRVFELGKARARKTSAPVRFAREVTEVVGAEQAMNQLVFTMSETFAHLKVGLLIFDAELRLTLFNPAIVDLFAEDAAWLATRPQLRVLLDRMRNARNLPEQSHYPEWRSKLLDRLEGEEVRPFEEKWRLPDGRTIKALFRPHPSGGLAMVLEDVTESLDLRRKSASDRAVSNATTELLDEGIAVFGPDGVLRMSNPSFRTIWGLTAEFCDQSRHVSEIVAACAPATMGDASFWERLKAASTHGGGAAALREKICNAESRVFIAKTSYAPDGSMLVVFDEISAEERMAAALRERNDVLEQADEMRSALVDQISHQMRTPLNSVLGFGHLLADESVGELTNVQREYVEGVIDSARDLVDAIDGMSDLISFNADDSEETLTPINFGDSVNEVLSMVKSRLGDRAPAVETRVSEAAKVLVTEGRRGRLRQIMFNMLLDAGGKSRAGGEVVLEADVVAEALSLTCSYVADNPSDGGGLALSLVRRFSRLGGGDASLDLNGDKATIRCQLPIDFLIGGARDIAQDPATSRETFG